MIMGGIENHPGNGDADYYGGNVASLKIIQAMGLLLFNIIIIVIYYYYHPGIQASLKYPGNGFVAKNFREFYTKLAEREEAEEEE